MANTNADRRAPARSGLGVAGVIAAGGGVAVLVAGGLTALSGARPLAALGLPDPGALTTIGLPVVRTVAELAMVVTIGSLLLAAFLVPPQRSGVLDVAGYRGLRVAGMAAVVWAAAAALLVPLSVADALGRPVGEVLDVGLLLDVGPRVAGAPEWFLTTLAALVVLVGSRTVLT